jgi:hypothetical protein
MLRLDADAPKPPAYPFMNQSVSKSHRQTKNVRSANFLAYPFAPCLQIFRTAAFVSVRFDPSPSLFRFGEGLFTDGARNPQEQKTPFGQNFCG